MAEDPHEALKRFVMTNHLIEHDLDLVEAQYGINLKRDHRRIVEPDQAYYPQIEQAIRAEAARMAPHYEVFYSLEKTIRGLVSDSLYSAEGQNWWESQRIPPNIKGEAEARRQREIDTGMTPRSDEQLDFTTFGELGEIIKRNWDIFGGMFSSVKAVERVMSNLNSLRGPIAHCSPLAEDEVVRLRLAVRDWFRLMELSPLCLSHLSCGDRFEAHRAIACSAFMDIYPSLLDLLSVEPSPQQLLHGFLWL